MKLVNIPATRRLANIQQCLAALSGKPPTSPVNTKDWGGVTYDSVNLDGTHRVFNSATGYSAEHLGWAHGDLLINFQLDGANGGSGSITAFIHKMTIVRW
jgi:hypothetical protein